MINAPKYQKYTKIQFVVPGSDVEIEGSTMLCAWRASTDETYYITRSTTPGHPGYYRVYSHQIRKVYAPPPRADGMAL